MTIEAGGDINAGDGGYNLSTQERYEEFAKQRSQMMNERIRELMDLAGIDVEAVENLGEMPTALKFAELIVRECAEIADNADATREKWQSIGKFVREHFGVE
jgi:hypothetical protein